MAGEKYRSAFTKADLLKADSIAVVKGESIWLGSYQVPVGENVILGWGNSNDQAGADGRIRVDLNTSTPAEVNGTIRIALYSPLNRLITYVDEFRTETLRAGDDDRTKQVPFSERKYQVTPFKKIVVEFVPDADATISKADSTLIMDIARIAA